MINRIFFLVTLPILFSIQSFAGEFLVHDEIYEWGTDASEGKRSWYFDGAGPANWLTPDNYYSGQFYFRYEILSQPTSRACQMQFVIWQDWNYPTSWLEQASPLTTVYGPGSIITTNSSPATWWQYNGQPLDFSRPADFYKFGVMVWSADPSGRIAQYLADRPEVDIYDEIWADRFDWFPLQVRFTIVAVSAGSTFSGWENYVDGTTPPPPPPPPPADSCENIADSPAPGPNAVQAENMTLNNYYQQGLIGASGGMVAGLWNPNTGLSNESGSISTNFTLSDGIYDIEVVYLDENDGESPFNLKLNGTTINSWVGELQECQNKYTKITTTNVTILNGDLITIEGQKADNAFAKVDYIDFVYISDIYTDYPEFSIDYFNERTGELVTGEYQYSYNQSDWITGTDSYLTLTPGQDVYFRYVTAPANIQHLEVDGRPSAPAFTVDYSLETTLQAVSSDYQYSTAANLSGAVTGAGSSVELTPGQNLFFAAMSTETSFRSEIQTLIVPSRPSAPPAIDINFPSETTGSVIGNTIEYAVTADMVASTAGTGTAVSLVPGQDLYFRYISTVSSFASYIYHLDVPERPEGPVFTVNFVSETTNETLSPSIEFSLSAGMETPASGDGNVLDLEAATDYYFRKLPTATEFRSAVTNLQTPTRPEFLTDYTLLLVVSCV